MSNERLKPPRIAEFLLRYLAPDNFHNVSPGDFEEVYRQVARDRGYFAAWIWYWLQVLRSIPSFIKEVFHRSGIMFKNYLKVAFRTILKDKLYNLINISGLAIGVSCCLLIMLYVKYELSFDGFHSNSDRTYRVIEIQSFEGKNPYHTPVTPGTMSQVLIDEYPEVENSTKLFSFNDREIIFEKNILKIDNFLFADQNFLDIFDFNLISGDPNTVLSEPYTIIVSKETAQKLFGDANPIGRSVKDDRNNVYSITGVIENSPENSHISYDLIASWSSVENIGFLNRWLTQVVYTYVRLSERNDPEEFELKLPGLVEKYMPNRVENYRLYLQPLKDIHLKSGNMLYDFNYKKGDGYKLFLFPIFALSVLVIGSINFINLTGSRSIDRAREVGLRKVVGATRSQLVKRFLGETILLAFISLLCGIILTVLALGEFNTLLNRQLQFGSLFDLPVISGMFLLMMLIGIISGGYPAFFISSFRPVQILNKNVGSTLKWSGLRKILVLFQFSVSVVLLLSTIMIYRQLEYISSKDLGFNKESLIVLNTPKPELMPKYNSFKQELLKNPGITKVGGSSHIMGLSSYSTYKVEPEGYKSSNEWNIPLIAVDYDFIPALGIELLTGRNFSPDFSVDRINGIVINETFAEKLNWDKPVGKKIGFNEAGYIEGIVIGVAKDFHIKSLHNEIEPLILYMDLNRLWKISIRLRSENLSQTLRYIEKKWNDFDPVTSFEFKFLDESFEKLYSNDERTGKTIGYIMILTIFIACMGSFGLASFSIEKRKKEFGIRKVLGADFFRLLTLNVKDFVVIILLSNIIAIPVSYILINGWLNNFPYRTGMGLDVFLYTVLISLLLTIISVSYQSIKAAFENPVDSLRYE